MNNKTLKKALYLPLGLFIATLVLESFLQLGAWIVQGSVRDMPLGWRTGNIRILAVGDSNTYGLYLQESESYPRQLEQQWNADKTLPPIEVVNLGYPGTNSFRMREHFAEIMGIFEPDIVLMMVGFNDFWTPHEEVAGNDAAGIIQWLKANSRLYRLLIMWQRKNIDPDSIISGADFQRPLSEDEVAEIERETGISREKLQVLADSENKNALENKALLASYNRIMEKRKQVGPGSEHVLRYDRRDFFLGVKPGEPSRNMRHLQANLVAMAQVAQQHQARFYLLTYPSEAGFYPAANRWIRKTADEDNIDLIDITPVLTALCIGDEPCPEYYFYDYHATAKGNSLVARSVAEALRQANGINGINRQNP